MRVRWHACPRGCCNVRPSHRFFSSKVADLVLTTEPQRDDDDDDDGASSRRVVDVVRPALSKSTFGAQTSATHTRARARSLAHDCTTPSKTAVSGRNDNDDDDDDDDADGANLPISSIGLVATTSNSSVWKVRECNPARSVSAKLNIIPVLLASPLKKLSVFAHQQTVCMYGMPGEANKNKHIERHQPHRPRASP